MTSFFNNFKMQKTLAEFIDINLIVIDNKSMELIRKSIIE